jgi:hypothetical protein
VRAGISAVTVNDRIGYYVSDGGGGDSRSADGSKVFRGETVYVDRSQTFSGLPFGQLSTLAYDIDLTP